MLLTVTRLITAGLLIGSAAAFAAGAAIEHHTATSEQHASGGEHRTAPHAEAGQRSEKPATSEHAPGREGSAAHAAEQNSETLLGINPESTGLVVTAVAVSLALAALILTVGSPLLAAGVTLAMLAFAALDIRELIHQLNESRPGLAALAGAVAALHLLAAAAALLTARDQRVRPGISNPA